MRAALALLALALLSPSLAAAHALGDESAVDPCRGVDTFRPGPTTQATPADRQRFAGASADECQALFYAPPGERDVDAARRCCLVTDDCNRELAILFANGWGVTRDYEAAAWFLCRAGEEMAPFEQEGMLDHLREMRDAGASGGSPGALADLDYCEHVTSGHGMLFCARLDFDRAEDEWERRLASLGSRLSPRARAALAPLREAAEAFSEKDGAWLADSSFGGTIYPSQALGERQATFGRFMDALDGLAARRASPAAASDLARADRDLNAAYKEAMASASEETGRQALREAQRAWITYRDRWIDFYRLRWSDPTNAARAAELDREIAATLSSTRAAELRIGAEAP